MKSFADFKNKLKEKGLKVTPQRISVFEALNNLNHPSAEQIHDYIRENYSGISFGTIYSILEIFADKGLVQKVKTGADIMRYDAITEKHHHLYCSECNKIEDYYDAELNKLLEDYFKHRQIPNFSIDDIKLQIVGQFYNKPNKN